MLFKAESFANDIHWNLIFALQTLNNLLLSVFKDSCVSYISLKFLVITSVLFFWNCRTCPWSSVVLSFVILCNMTFLSSGRCIILIFVLRLELNLESYCRLRYVQNYCLWTREGLWLHRLGLPSCLKYWSRTESRHFTP